MEESENVTMIMREPDYEENAARTEKISMILRQTDYSEDLAIEKLLLFNDDPIKVIQNYMGITEKKAPLKSLNQEIYRQLRSKLDDSIKSYNIKHYEKIKQDLNR
jgi:hypothetical protein